MDKKSFLNGLFYSSIAALIWGFVQVLYFKNIDYIPPIETVSHRGIWAFFFLIILIFAKKNYTEFISIFTNKKKFFYLSITSVLITSNWLFFILSIFINRVHDAAMGYFISPILSVGFGYIFFKEKLSKIQILSLSLIILSILNLIVNLGTIPWIAISLATTWSIYGLLRKKIRVASEVGLLFETSILLPFFFIYCFYLYSTGKSHFSLSDIPSTLFLIGSGFVTALPLFLFNLGLKKIPLSVAGLIFYLVPTLQFLTSVIILGEIIDNLKIISFIIIWVAILAFLYESIKNNKNII